MCLMVCLSIHLSPDSDRSTHINNYNNVIAKRPVVRGHFESEAMKQLLYKESVAPSIRCLFVELRTTWEHMSAMR